MSILPPDPAGHACPASDALPTYTVRVSPRARRVRLVVSAREGLVVVVPRHFPERRVPPIVDARRAWIARALDGVRERREMLLTTRDVLPDVVDLAGIGESLRVSYRPTPAAGVRCTIRGGVLHVTGDLTDRGVVREAVLRAVRKRAAESLPPLLERLSAEECLPFGTVRVRAQRTRWGSCTSRDNISLNWRLAFLPPRLVRHVMLHELVHTLRHDHSRVFHELLREREPDVTALAAELRAAWHHVPGWAADG